MFEIWIGIGGDNEPAGGGLVIMMKIFKKRKVNANIPLVEWS